MQLQARLGVVRILVNMVDPLGVERRRAAFDAVNLISLGEQELS
jgi:hypothetical protein